jgi:hypothetical protein
MSVVAEVEILGDFESGLCQVSESVRLLPKS